MGTGLTDIADRLTPSAPIELSFDAQPVATGKKFTTIIGHKATSGATVADNTVYQVTNVGNAAAAVAEVAALAGAGAPILALVAAFINANLLAGRSNFPAFRVVLMAHSETAFGTSQAALTAIQNLRSDMIVSPYPAGNSGNVTLLLNFIASISGADRDLNGQFGSFATFGSVDVLSTAVLYAINSRGGIVAYLQDTNTAAITENGVLTMGSNVITAIPSTAGIYPGATISGTGVPAGALVGTTTLTTATMVDVNGAPLNAAAAESSESIVFQNVVSQTPAVVAAGHAGAMMASAFPYNPLQGVQIGGLLLPKKASDLIIVDPNGASEQALAAGLSPLRPLPGGGIGFIRTRTTYNLLTDGVTAATAYFDWQDLVVMNDFRESCYQITQNPPFNGNPGGTKASATIAAKLKDEILREAQSFEDQGAFQAVKALAPQFLVLPSTSSRGRFDFKIPINVLPGLFVIAGNIQGTTSFDFSL
jgi:hypothetical protein